MKTKEKKKNKGKKALIIIASIIGVLIILCGVFALINFIGYQSNRNFIKTIPAVEYENQLEPTVADDGYYTFVTDDNLRVMQLTDIHIGAGFMSIKKDTKALNAVAAMIAAEKPDLVVVTGDIAYPVTFQSGTFNNKTSARLFAELMEQLGVYWAMTFGNHDTESYSYFNREEICDFYTSGEFSHCLLQAGPKDVDGEGNYIINVKNTAGKIVQSLIMMDSQAYMNNENVFASVIMKYDRIHDNQVEWYKNEIQALTDENGGEVPKSMAFFHIPLIEYRDAWQEYVNNNKQDTENAKLIYGTVGEKDDNIFCPDENCGLFDAALELGSTQAFFCGHDHLNNFQINYKGINLTYGYSIDYLAYFGIAKYGAQRGCTMININQDGSFTSTLENYYQDKYSAVNAKENVSMEPMTPIY